MQWMYVLPFASARCRHSAALAARADVQSDIMSAFLTDPIVQREARDTLEELWCVLAEQSTDSMVAFCHRLQADGPISAADYGRLSMMAVGVVKFCVSQNDGGHELSDMLTPDDADYGPPAKRSRGSESEAPTPPASDTEEEEGIMDSASSSDETEPAPHIDSDSDDAAELAPAIVLYEEPSDHAGPVTVVMSSGEDSDSE